MRSRNAVARKKRKKKLFKATKGYWGAKSKLYRSAKQAYRKSLLHAYNDRKKKKRNFRKLWISRINAASRKNGLKYSQFIHGLKKAGIKLNRKMLSEMAIHDETGFAELVNLAKKELNG